MPILKFKKVNSVPGVLDANTIYIVKNGTHHILYITDKDATVSYKSYDSVDIAAISSAYITSMIGQPDGIAGLDGAGNLLQSASLSTYEVTLDFGTIPIQGKKFSIVNANVHTTSKIFFTPSASPAAGRQSDELEMDGFSCAGVCTVDGTMDVYITANPGPVSGQFKFNYFLG